MTKSVAGSAPRLLEPKQETDMKVRSEPYLPHSLAIHCLVSFLRSPKWCPTIECVLLCCAQRSFVALLIFVSSHNNTALDSQLVLTSNEGSRFRDVSISQQTPHATVSI